MYPQESENLNEDVIFDRGKSLVKRAQKADFENQKKDIIQKATDKRREILTSLPESAEEFKYDIEQILKETTDNNIMADDFQVDQLITWARGKKFTKTHVKELIDSAFKRGQEQASIVGERTKVGGARPLSQETFSYNLTTSTMQRTI